jgi:transcriptional regulator of acetoin/glycerol metabolism
MARTLTRDGDPSPLAADRLVARLVFLASADDLAMPSSSHVLDGLDEVRFVRGPRAATRAARSLVLASPDRRMSSVNGALVRRGDRWVLDDPASKNGAVVDGIVTRRQVLRDGTILELGHSFFVFRQSRLTAIPPHLEGDVDQLPSGPPGMATFAPLLAAQMAALPRLAASLIPILVRGETGTGKELVARAVHALAQRPGPFVAVNCGALPAALIGSELFGHRRGAFSGALTDRKGLIRNADGGTLFLDEIAELDLPAQAALLRVLQEREVQAVGEDRPVKVDVRVVAATHRDFAAAIAEGTFRLDLYARIAGHEITLLPLRERREDLGLLLRDLLARHADRPLGIAVAALRALVRCDWPRNVRELEQTIATAAKLADATIEPAHLPDSVRAPTPAPAVAPAQAALGDRDDDLRAQITAALAEHGGNIVAVSKALGKRRTTIYKWVKRFAIDLDAFR